MSHAYHDPIASKRHFLEGIVRVGRVTQVDTTNRISATVSYTDRNFQTGYIPCLQKNTLGTQEFYVPVVGENVWVLHLPNSIERGLILGSTYTVGNPPPYNVQTTRGIVFADGSFITYDTNGGGLYHISVKNFTASVNGTTTITANSINLNGVIIDSSGNLTIPSGQTLKSDKFAGTSGTPVANPRMTNQDASGAGS